jgi:hypothetical protein
VLRSSARALRAISVVVRALAFALLPGRSVIGGIS